MQIMILCGGMGTRLREHTETRPKPMVEVGGVPIVVHIMRMYAAAGFTEFILCLGYKGKVIKDYFLNYEAMNRDFTVDLGRPGSVDYHLGKDAPVSWRVTLADTGETALTGARIARAARYLRPGETFGVTYGDGVADVRLEEVHAFHRRHGKLATVTGVRPASRFGEIEHNDEGVVREFNEKPNAGQGLINGGFFFFEHSFLRYLRPDADCALERAPMEQCVRDGELVVYEHLGFWQCMDTYRDWERLESHVKAGDAPWLGRAPLQGGDVRFRSIAPIAPRG
jgi:glucose-1-phosphate cytidylyltransferase